MLFPDTETVRSLFSLPLDLYFHLGENFIHSPFYSSKRWLRKASIREAESKKKARVPFGIEIYFHLGEIFIHCLFLLPKAVAQ
ncbi:MAG: hypothetical protein IKD31_01775 [Clostridia bacterium]|nr:hypothetical protein [Clostridia bacterium]